MEGAMAEGTVLLDGAVDALPLRLLRDELSIDAEAGEVAGATALMPRLVGLVVGGFGAHALVVAGTAWPSLGPGPALQLGASLWLATTAGYFAAICAGLPSYWFYGIVARIEAPAWRLALELVRSQAVGSVVLVGILPFWLAACLGLHLLQVDVYRSPLMLLTYGLPLVTGLPGTLGLYRVFERMRVALGEQGKLPALVLVAWWVGLFLYTAPITVWALFDALAGR
jgi:hypothetical protein